MTDRPTSSVQESVSALVDGEANELDLQRVLKALDGDEASIARESWSRYHLSSRLINNEQKVDLSIDLSIAIRAAIESENSAETTSLPAEKKWWNAIGKTAVAASVTLGVVFGVSQLTSVQQQAQPQALVNNAAQTNPETSLGANVPQGFELPPLSAQTVSTNSLIQERQFVPVARSMSSSPKRSNPIVEPLPHSQIKSRQELEAEMSRLLYRHAKQAAGAGGLGALPYARADIMVEESSTANSGSGR